MNKCILLLTILAAAGMVSRLNLTDSDESSPAPGSSAVLGSQGGKARAFPSRRRAPLPAPEVRRYVPPFAETADLAAGESSASSSETRQVEIPGPLVPEELEWREVEAEENTAATPLQWENPYGGDWHDQGGG